MNKLDEKSEKQISDMDDERFWDDFSRELWFMFKKAEAAPDFTTEKPQSGARKNCLTFNRCAEIGRTQINPSDSEKKHLQNCRFCTRRIQKYGILPKLNVEAETNEETLQTEEKNKRNWWTKFFGGERGFNGFAGKFAFASGILITLLGTGIIILLLNLNRTEERLATISDPNNELPNFETANFSANNGAENESNKQIPANLKANKANTAANKKETLPSSNEQITENSFEIAFLSGNEREVVRQSIEAGRIQISEDIAKLRENPIVRNGNNFAPQIAPKDEAVWENQPILTWRTDQDSEYRIVILDQGFNEVAKSEILTQNNWRINKKLTADFYFWQVLVRKKGTAEFNSDGEKAYFKIVGQKEKTQIEKAKISNNSRIVAAVLYARAGLFREAERELETEIRRNNSGKARRMLIQVRRWQSK